MERENRSLGYRGPSLHALGMRQITPGACLFRAAKTLAYRLAINCFFLSDTKLPQRALDAWAHNVPTEFCIAMAQVTEFLVSELLIEADLLELIEEGKAPQQAIGVSVWVA